MSKLEFNKKLIGKIVYVLESDHTWRGKVLDVVDESTFLVEMIDNPKESPVTVDIYDIRQD